MSTAPLGLAVFSALHWRSSIATAVENRVGMAVKRGSCKIFCQKVRALVLRADLLHADIVEYVMVAHEVTVQFDVFVSAGNDWVFYHFYVGFVILVQDGGPSFLPADFGKQIP